MIHFPGNVFGFFLGASSIAALLLYFYGFTGMGPAVRAVTLPGLTLLTLLAIWARLFGREALWERLMAGLWAGALATLAYDVVRLPISLWDVPVFKSISYFGTLILDLPSPTPLSEWVGWTYHLTNGVTFGLMYALIVKVPRWWTAVLWGVLLEGAMLVTPYAEVFGYQMAPPFVAITLSAHVVYGLALWWALVSWSSFQSSPQPVKPRPFRFRFVTGMVLAILGIGGVAWSFHQQHAHRIPASPPSYIGPHLYTTWDVAEPDRLAALWVLKRFLDPEARYYFVPPMTRITFGQAFDTPEADMRRSATASATEVLVETNKLSIDPKLALLAEMTHLYEISRWMLSSHPDAQRLGQELVEAANGCQKFLTPNCLNPVFAFLDHWYEASPTQ